MTEQAKQTISELESALAAMREEREKATDVVWPQDVADLIEMAREWGGGEDEDGDLVFSGDVLIHKLGNALAHLTEEREGLRAELALKTAADCEVCWTNSWEPVEHQPACELQHPHKGPCRHCGHCALYETFKALTAAHERVRGLIEKWRKDGEENDSRDAIAHADELESALTSPEEPPDDGPWDPDPACPTCRGSGEASNAQFTCACRWTRRPTSPEGPQNKDHEDQKDNLTRVDTKAPSLDNRTAATDTKGSA